jgi:hypothetical protein
LPTYKRCSAVSLSVEADCVGRILKTDAGIAISRNAIRIHAAKSGAVSGISGISTPRVTPSVSTLTTGLKLYRPGSSCPPYSAVHACILSTVMAGKTRELAGETSRTVTPPHPAKPKPMTTPSERTNRTIRTSRFSEECQGHLPAGNFSAMHQSTEPSGRKIAEVVATVVIRHLGNQLS